MVRLRLDKYKPWVALGVFFIAWWLLPTFVKSFMRLSFEEFQTPAWIATSQLDQLKDFWARRSYSKIELIQAGKELARQKAHYQSLAQRHDTLTAEIKRLETMLHLPGHPEFRTEIARVIRRDINAWWQQFVIRKGSDYGIQEGSAVVFAGGIVGRIVKVNALTSHVELVSSPNFRMAAIFEGDGRPAVYQGAAPSGFIKPFGEVRNVPQDIHAHSQTPLKLVSTSLGGTFPPGLVIGTVNWLAPDHSGIFQTGQVTFDRQLLSLKEVAVLIPNNPLDSQHHDD